MIGKAETVPIPSFACLNHSFLTSKTGNRFREQERRTHITHEKSMS